MIKEGQEVEPGRGVGLECYKIYAGLLLLGIEEIWVFFICMCVSTIIFFGI